MPSAKKLSLHRETLLELTTEEMSEIGGGEAWSSNPACILSIGPCVTVLCSNVRTICLADTAGM